MSNFYYKLQTSKSAGSLPSKAQPGLSPSLSSPPPGGFPGPSDQSL